MNIQAVNAAYGNTYGAKKSEYKSVPAHKAIQTEKVEISSQSSQLQTVRAALDEMNDVRLDMVKKIKARIKNNDYPIENNLNKVLKEMIQSNILKPF